MTSEEAKEALMSQCPVIYNGVEYQYIEAIVYRKSKSTGSVAVFLQLYDKCGHSLIETKLKDVELKQLDNAPTA